jgi:hypothetical protein
MTEPLDLHNEAMSYAFLADNAKRKDDFIEYLALIKKAFALDKEASLMLKDNLGAEPTRSVLLRSAATLAVQCGEYDEAIQLVAYGLIGNPGAELKAELMDILNEVTLEQEGSQEQLRNSNAYLQFLRNKAINIKIDTKPNAFYSRAVEVDAVLTALRNFKTSILNYIEVSFKKTFQVNDFDDFGNTLSLIKKGFNPLLVNLSFKSFSASICVDDVVMSKNYRQSILAWKDEHLFERFKEDVIDIDYNSVTNLKYLTDKFTPEERHLIYNPIIDTVKNISKYRIHITDKDFKHYQKTFEPITKSAKEILSPKIVYPPSENPKILIQSFALVDEPGQVGKKTIFDYHEMESAEFRRTINQVSHGRDYLVVRTPFELTIVYKRPDFFIDDDKFEIYTRGNSMHDVMLSYNKILINMFNRYKEIGDDDLLLDERALKQRLLNTFTFGTGGINK